MGDMGDIFNAMKADRKAKRKSNKEKSTQILVNEGFEFESKNGGVHLIVTTPRGIVDFWPSTGLWHNRGNNGKPKGRGVRQLINFARGGKRVN